MRILQISANYIPNLGGVETHISDLVNGLVRRGNKVFVLSYIPLTSKVDYKLFEEKKNLTIFRTPWIKGFFEKLVKTPVLEFIYLVPGLFIVSPFVISKFKPDKIHAHGLISAVPAVFWGKIFNKKVIVSLHNIYSFPDKGYYRQFVRFLLSKCDVVLSLSKKSYEEVIMMDIDKNKARTFTYWIDLERFKKKPLFKKIDRKNDFIVLFAGRLVEEKGVKELIYSSKKWNKNIKLLIAGSGPLESEVRNRSLGQKNIIFLGRLEQDEIPLIYSSANLLIMPSISEEGFGRVIIESLACSTPVLASNKGSISEVMDETVGKMIEINPENIKKWVEYYYFHPKELKKMSSNARRFVQRRYSEKNIEQIIKSYT